MMRRLPLYKCILIGLLLFVFAGALAFPWRAEPTGRWELRDEITCVKHKTNYGPKGMSYQSCAQSKVVSVKWCEYTYTNAFTSWQSFGGFCKVSRVKPT